MSLSDLPAISDEQYEGYRTSKFDAAAERLTGSLDFDKAVSDQLSIWQPLAPLEPPPAPTPTPTPTDVPEDVSRRQDAARGLAPQANASTFDHLAGSLMGSLDDGNVEPQGPQLPPGVGDVAGPPTLDRPRESGFTTLGRTLTTMADAGSGEDANPVQRFAAGATRGAGNMLVNMGGSADAARESMAAGDVWGSAGNLVAGAMQGVSPGAIPHAALKEVGAPDWAANAAGLVGDFAMPQKGIEEGIGLTARGVKAAAPLVGRAVSEAGGVVPLLERAEARLPGEMPPSTVKGLGKAVERLASDEIPDLAQPIVKTAAEEVERLRLDKFPEELRPLIQDAAERMNFATGQRRGVISDAAAETMADEIGRTTEQWLRTGKQGRAYNTEEIRALANSITTQAARVRELGLEVAKPGGDSTLATAQLIIEGDKLAALTALREGSKAEAGRALRAFAQEARLSTDPNDAISRIFQKVGGADKAREVASEYATMVEQGADPIQMAMFWSKVENPKITFGDWLKALRYNSMLSGPRSMEVDIVGTGAEVPWKLARDTVASLGRAAYTRSAEPMRELGPEFAGIWSGAVKGGGALLEAMAHGITSERALAGDLPRDLISRLDNPGAKAAAWSLEWVTRFKGGINEFQQQTAYGMAYGRLAGRQATREGLAGQAWAKRVTELTANPSELPSLAKQAMSDAERLTYQNPLGKQGRNIAEARRKGGIAGHIILPFYPTIANITARGIDRSPIGLVGTAVDVARGKYGSLASKEGRAQLRRAWGGEMLPNADKGLRPLGERAGDALMGTAVGTWFTTQAFQGNLSASGPTNSQERDVLRAQGWQPYSVRLPLPGVGDRWVSYANWGPAAITLSGAASIAEAHIYKAPKADAIAITTDAMRRFGEVFTEQTYLQSIGAVYKAIREPDRYGAQWINSFMTSLVPEGSLLNTIGQAGDPSNRQVSTTGDAFASRIPGLRQQLPEKRTVFGDVEPNPYAGPLGFISPFRVAAQPNAATANVRRFIGSPSAARDYQIAQAIGRVDNWRNKPREYPRPTQEEVALANRFKGRENPRYTALIQQAAARSRQAGVSRGG